MRSSFIKPGKSLLEMWNSSVCTEVSKKEREFFKAGPGKAKLYANIDKEHEV